MRLTIAGVHMDVGEALKEYTEEKVQALSTFFDKLTDVDVRFHHEPPKRHLSELIIRANGLLLRAEGEGADWYGCVDDALAKIHKQLDKYKGRLEKRRVTRRELKEQVAFDVLHFEEAEVQTDGLDGMVDGAFADFAPAIVRKEVSQLSPMSVDDAVMQMDLLHKPAFLFVNHDTNELNMVYREGENAIRWVAPKKGI